MSESSPPAAASDTPLDRRIPITIGVTGHRDLPPLDGLRTAVQRILQDTRSLCRNSDLLVLSPLAEGADQLVAEEALAFGARLVVPLPMPVDEYRRDFTAPGARDRFEALLGKADAWFEVPARRDGGPGEQDFRVPGRARDFRYLAAGVWVARHSHVLIALWNGLPSSEIAGTAAVVKVHREGVSDPDALPISPLDPVDSGAIHHLSTPRLQSAETADPPLSWRLLYPSVPVASGGRPLPAEELRRLAYEEHRRLLADTDRFNRDVRARMPRRAGPADGADLIPAALRDAQPPGIRRALALHGGADGLARRWQRRTRWALFAIFALLLQGVFAFQLYQEVPALTWGLLTYPVTLALAGGVFLAVSRTGSEDRHLDDRALAEGLRVQCFWWMAGVREEVADHYLRQQRTELDWVRHGLRTAAIPRGGPRGEHAPFPEALDADGRLALRHWVENQRDWFERAADRDVRRKRGLDRFSNGLFWAGVLAAVALAADLWLVRIPEGPFRSGLLVGLSVALAGAAALRGFAAWLGLADQARQYARMSALFRRAAQRLSDLIEGGHRDEARALLRELGREALAESGWWVLMHRVRPLDWKS